MRRSPVRRQSARRRRRDATYPAARQAVYARADGACEASNYGFPCGNPMTDIHHLAGRNISEPHDLSNLVGLCSWHHRKVHAEPAWAYETGLMRKRHGANP